MPQEGYGFFEYKPLKWVQLHFSANFGVLAIIQLCYLYYTYRKYEKAVIKKSLRRYINVMIPLVLGFLLECAAYTARTISSESYESVAPFVIQSLFLQIGPSCISSTLYVCFGILLTSLNAESYTFINPKYSTIILISGEILCNFLNGLGGTIKGYFDNKIGTIIILITLLVQLALIMVFMTNIVKFCYYYRKYPTKRGITLTNNKPLLGSWKHAICALFLSSILLFIRIAYRSASYLTSTTNPVNSKEIYLFILDGAMSLVACATMSTINFSYLFSMIDSEFISIYENRDLETLNSIC